MEFPNFTDEASRISTEVSTLLTRAHTAGELLVKSALDRGGSALLEIDKMTDGCWGNKSKDEIQTQDVTVTD